MRAAVFSTVCASVTFFAPGADLRPAQVVAQPAVQVAVEPALQPQFPEFVVSAAPQVVVATPAARADGSADASARWFAYGLFGALCTVALRSAARAAPSVPRPAARIQPLRMSAAAVAEKEDAAWDLARDAIASRTRTGYWSTSSPAPGTWSALASVLPSADAMYWGGLGTQSTGSGAEKGSTAPGTWSALATVLPSADALYWGGLGTQSASSSSGATTDIEAGFTDTEISDAMQQLSRVWRKREDGFWEDAESEEQKRARAIEALREAVAKKAAETARVVDSRDRYAWPKPSRPSRPQAVRAAAGAATAAAATTSAATATSSAATAPSAAAGAATASVVSSAADATSAVAGVVVPTATSKPKKAKKEPTRVSWEDGIFAPAVATAKQVMGEQELKEFRASVIAKHSKVIGNFVDTSESQFGQLVLKRMFDYADKDGNGTLDKEEVRSALLDLGFDFLDEKSVEKLIKNADKDQNDVIDFEEFVQATPKALRINLVKLAKKNGHDLGFLV